MDEIAQGDVLPDEMRTTEEDDPVLEAPEAESPESEALLG